MRSRSLHGTASAFGDLSAFDALDLAAKAAALQLAPENTDRLQRLYAIAGFAACTPVDDQRRPQISSGRLRRALNEPPLSESRFALAEDPYNNPLTETIAFYGGSYVAIADYDGDAAYVFRRLAEAIFLFDEAFSSPSFVSEARSLCLAALALGDAVTKRADFSRIEEYAEEPLAPFFFATSPGGTDALNQELASLPEGFSHPVLEELQERGAPPGNVTLPPAERFGSLQRAVSFCQEELAMLLGKVGVSAEALEIVTMDRGMTSFPPWDIDRNPLFTRPLLRDGDQLVVALPRVLLSAACNALIRKALEHGVGEEFAARFREAVAYNVRRSLELLGCVPLPPPVPNAEGTSLPLFSLDSDKVVHVLLVTEGTAQYDPETRRGEDWRGGKVTARIKRRLAEVESAILGLPVAPGDILHLVVLQGLEPITTLRGLRPPKTKRGRGLLLDASDLETIATLEAGDQLALWKYAGEQLRFRRVAEVNRISSQLDEFYAYRRYGYGYDFFSGGIPRRSERVFVTVPMGGAGALRREAQRKRDFHGAPSPKFGTTVEVASFYEDHSIPIYAPWFIRLEEELQILVEGLPLDVWVTGPAGVAASEFRALYLQFAEAVAYWFWQLGPGLEPHLREAAGFKRRIVIRLELLSKEGWFDVETETVPHGEEVVQCVTTGNGDLTLRVHPDSKHLFGGADNAGEREFLRALLQGLGDALEDVTSHDVGLTGAEIQEILDRHAPLGRKKKLLFMGGEHNLLLLDENLPAYRKVQDPDLNELRDELGEFLSSELNLSRGPVPGARRSEVVRSAVGFLFKELERLVAELSPEGLLEALTAYNERLFNEYAQRALRIPTWVECFGSEAEMMDRLRREVPELSDASLASRFLIEYVVACPPWGERPFSLAAYDRLMAVASQIVNWGFTGDAIHLGIEDDLRLELSGSGKLEAYSDTSHAGRERFMDVHLAGEIYRTNQGFDLHWREPAPEGPNRSEQMTEATTAEFGVNLDDLTDFLLEASRLGMSIEGEPKVVEVKDFLEEIGRRLEWDRHRVERAFELFVLRPRPSFLAPPVPFEAADVYPWRFNRGLSHLRRPLLVRAAEQGEEVVWGVKACFRAALYLGELCFEGRLKAKSKPMRHLISSLHHRRSERFNDAVADHFAADASLTVERRVKKIAGRRIKRGSGQDLGDIDVLVVDPSRRILWAIETKDLAFARTPAELANELKTTFAAGGRKPSAAERHLERTAWLRENLASVLGSLGLSANAAHRWRVQPLMVVDHELRSPYVSDCPVPVVPFLELQGSHGDALALLNSRKR